jgi:dTDP-4-amino-4,6-dideoxygalactose transaminase
MASFQSDIQRGEGDLGSTTGRGLMRSLTTTDARGVGRLIPRPDIPLSPVLSWHTFAPVRFSSTPAVVDNRRVIHVTAGRVAIAHALELAGIGAGQKVLVPAYHCISMVEPLLQVGALPVFYALRDDLSVDLDDVARKIDGETRGMTTVNYFGFAQDLSLLRRFCDERGLCFVEDCAHSFFGSFAGRPLGAFGHFAIASLTKFFPVRDGGCLVLGANASTDPKMRLRSQGLGASVAAAVDCVEEAVSLGRLRGLAPAVVLSNWAKRIARSTLHPTALRHSDNPAQWRSGKKGGFDPAWMDVCATATSRAIARYAERSRIVEARRRNYARLLRDFSGLRRCRPVFSRLPDGVVPYMFPLWIDHLDDVFADLEDRAIPMQRFGQFLWPDMDEGFCAITRRLSRDSIQLPCHQDLTEDEIGTLVGRVRAIVR